jgi:hypothetical protein
MFLKIEYMYFKYAQSATDTHITYYVLSHPHANPTTVTLVILKETETQIVK